MTDGYNATYGTGETSEAAIDIVVGVGAALFSFATLIALVLIFRWLKKNARL